MYPGRSFVAEATGAGIPFGAIVLMCRNWGLPAASCCELAEEAAQEAHLRGLDHPFPAFVDYSRWVTVIARRIVIDILRRRRKASNLGDAVHGLPAPLEVEEEGYLERLTALSAEDQQILRLAFVEDLTLDQIAAVLYPNDGASPNALRLRVKRQRDSALERLRKVCEARTNRGRDG